MTYWDAAPLIKLYVDEPDSPLFVKLKAELLGPVLSAAIVTTEALCTLYRKETSGEIKRGWGRRAFEKFRADVGAGRIATVPYSDDVADQAERLVNLAFSQPQPVMIRALDLIHVASAVVGKTDSLVTTDRRLRQLAALAGLKLLP